MTRQVDKELKVGDRVVVTNPNSLGERKGHIVEVRKGDVETKYRVCLPKRGCAFVFYSWELMRINKKELLL